MNYFSIVQRNESDRVAEKEIAFNYIGFITFNYFRFELKMLMMATKTKPFSWVIWSEQLLVFPFYPSRII